METNKSNNVKHEILDDGCILIKDHFSVVLGDEENITATISDIVIDHRAFHDCGSISANINIGEKSVKIFAFIHDDVIETDSYLDYDDHRSEIIAILEEDYDFSEEEQNDSMTIIEDELSRKCSIGAISEDEAYEKLMNAGFILFGKNPYNNFYWHVGKLLEDENSATTYGHYETLRALEVAMSHEINE